MSILTDLSDIQKTDSTPLAFEIPRELKAGRYGFLILFGADEYPLKQHFCYMRSKNKSQVSESPRRFVDMEFSPNPPGIPVGPWPSWRFIPPMPDVRLRINDASYRGRFNFWGDEIITKQLQVVVNADIPANATEIVLSCSDRRLRPVSVTLCECAKQKPQPVKTELKQEFRNTRPRLLFSSADIAELRKRKTGAHQHLWDEIINLKNNWALEFMLTPESKTIAGPERLHVFDRVVISAFVALMTQEESDIQLARETLCKFLDFALSPNFEPMQIDTQAGETLFTACIACDWLWVFFETDQKATVKNTLFAIAEHVWQHLGYERDDYAQAHFLGCSHGLLAFSFLFWQEHDRTREWVEYFHGVLNWVTAMLPEDGFYPHGINLWIYEHTFLLRYLELFRHCADVNFWNRTPYWQKASRFRAATLSPNHGFALTFGDPQYRVCGDAWMHFLLASRCRSEQAQALGNKLQPVSTEGVDFRSVTPRRKVWEYLFYDPKIHSKPSTQKSLFFEDGGQVFYRWADPKNQLLITFRADGLLGKQRYQAGEWSGYGHSDPCNGSFLVIKNDAFLICGPGPVYRRDTSLHNTITFDDRGQIGDGCPWAPEFVPEKRFTEILDRGEEENKQWITADLAPSYLDFLGVKKCIRRFFFIQPGLIIIHDDIELQESRNIQWNLHSPGEISPASNKKSFQFLISHRQEQAGLHCLFPTRLNYKTGLTDFVPAYPHSGKRDRFLQLSIKDTATQFLVLINLTGEKLFWQLFPDRHKTIGQIAKIMYAGDDYII